MQKREAKGEMVFDESKWNVAEDVASATVGEANKCVKNPMLIDFADMSFNDWIIEPKRFQSNYCSGSCKFPLNKVNFNNQDYSTGNK